MITRPLRGEVGIVRSLVAKVDTRARHPPIPMPTGKFLFVKVQVISISWISMIAAPHLDAGAGIASKERHLRLTAVRCVGKERLIEGGAWCSALLFHCDWHIAG